jgi:hypothetical protein
MALPPAAKTRTFIDFVTAEFERRGLAPWVGPAILRRSVRAKVAASESATATAFSLGRRFAAASRGRLRRRLRDCSSARGE